MTDPADDLARLLDRERILDVLAEYCERLDEYDIDGVGATFTDDCITDYGPGRGGVVTGRDAVRDRIARGQAEFRRTHHQLGQQRMRIDGDEAEAVSYLTAWHERWDGRQATVRLRYLDRLRRTPDGWRIASRRVEVTGVDGFDGVEWRWVPRAEPAKGPDA